ncbi:MAG: hypothetical protein Q4G26_14670 [Paracoccus sp. (in: a-proteobacteria)]|nr:hypothetical protein [Paracoccus sp. (in: a-proteobacteria)]
MMLTAQEQEARAALHKRQGRGQRHDAKSAPHDALLLARRGAAFFARALNELSDSAIYAPTPDGPSRAVVVARISFEARALAISLSALRGAAGSDMPDLDIGRSATLPAHALRHLFHHAAIHLDVEWRDLEGAHWDQSIAFADKQMPVRDTPLWRARRIWRGAVDLGQGARLADIPDILRD